MKQLITWMVLALFSSGHAMAGQSTPEAAKEKMNAHHFTLTSLEGEPMPLAQFKGKALLIVNTASKCGFTPQYEALEALHQTYKKRGLVVIGVPCNDFGEQEPDDEKDVKEFVRNKYNITFPLTTKTNVTGENIHPFFKWIGTNAGFVGNPKWNFYKYLIGKDGEFITWYSSMTSPESSKLKKAIETALEE